jgi:hypothetical protein
LKYAQENILAIDINPNNGAIEISYSKEDEKTVFRATLSELLINPLKRVPIFNILKSDSVLKPLIETYLDVFLSWKVTFFKRGHISINEEADKWRKNLKLTGKREVTTGVQRALQI